MFKKISTILDKIFLPTFDFIGLIFRYKITIVLKSGYEIRVRAKDYTIFMNGDSKGFMTVEIKTVRCDIREIAAVIIKHWYQRWA